MASLKKILKKKNYIRIPFVYTATNHIDKIEYFNLVTKESEVKAAGAGATNMATMISSKNKLEIGNWCKKKVKIVLFDLSHVNEALEAHKAFPVDGIIGADILKKAKALIDYDKDCIYLRIKPPKEPKPEA